MTTKEHQLAPIHDRFYLFSHVNGEDIKYRTSTGEWSDDFYDAMLWRGETFAEQKGKACKAQHQQRMVGLLQSQPDSPEQHRRFVVGSVRVEVRGQYAMKVV